MSIAKRLIELGVSKTLNRFYEAPEDIVQYPNESWDGIAIGYLISTKPQEIKEAVLSGRIYLSSKLMRLNVLAIQKTFVKYRPKQKDTNQTEMF